MLIKHFLLLMLQTVLLLNIFVETLIYFMQDSFMQLKITIIWTIFVAI